MTWAQLFEHWPLIFADLLDIGVDVGDPGVQSGRSWPWLRDAILGLLDKPGGSRLQRALAPSEPQPQANYG